MKSGWRVILRKSMKEIKSLKEIPDTRPIVGLVWPNGEKAYFQRIEWATDKYLLIARDNGVSANSYGESGTFASLMTNYLSSPSNKRFFSFDNDRELYRWLSINTVHLPDFNKEAEPKKTNKSVYESWVENNFPNKR